MFRLDRFGGSIREHRHHVQEVLKGNLPIVGAAEYLTDPVPERVDAQFRILEDFGHRQAGILVVADLLRSEGLEFFVRTARNDPGSQYRTGIRKQA